MKALSKADQDVLRLMSEGASDLEICQRLRMASPAFLRSVKRIEERASVESDDAGRFYERALRQRAERANVSLAARFHALMDVLPQAVLVVDGRTGVIKEFNMLACQMFGYTSYELQKLTVEDLVPKSVRSKHFALRLGFLASVRKREMGYHPPIMGIRKDGSELPMSIALTATVADDDVMVVCAEWSSASPLQPGKLEAEIS